MIITVEQETRGWTVFAHYPDGRMCRVGTYNARYQAVEHAARIGYVATIEPAHTLSKEHAG